MKEKSWEEIQAEYAIRKKESDASLNNVGTGHWEKCSRCFGTGSSSCSLCKGLGHISSSSVGVHNSSGIVECPQCHGSKQMPCRQYGCENGWIWITN